MLYIVEIKNSVDGIVREYIVEANSPNMAQSIFFSSEYKNYKEKVTKMGDTEYKNIIRIT